MAKMLLVFAAAIIMLTNGISAETYTVGDEDGWRVPSDPDFYSTWAAKHNFDVGDSLVFDFNGTHSVAVVSEEAYEKCDVEEVKANMVPTNIKLQKNGSFYFICTIGDHCDDGQKLAITVGTTAAMAPIMSPAESPSDDDVGSSPPMLLTSTFLSATTFMAFVIALQYN